MNLKNSILSILKETEELNELNLNIDQYSEGHPPSEFHKLPDDILNSLRFNEDDKIKLGRNYVYLDTKQVAKFGIKYIGNVRIDPEKYFEIIPNEERKLFQNSIFFHGGFYVYERGKGIGKAIIKKIFKDNSNIQNIFLYALDKQNAVKFWEGLGGKVLFSEEGLNYIQISRF